MWFVLMFILPATAQDGPYAWRPVAGYVYPQDWAWGDIDGDGDDDLAYAPRQWGLIPPLGLFWLENRDGDLSRRHWVDMTDAEYGCVALADADDDGDLDLFVTPRASAPDTNVVYTYRNTGDGGFAYSPIEFTRRLDTYARCQGFDDGDIDGDGATDVIGTWYYSTTSEPLVEWYSQLDEPTHVETLVDGYRPGRPQLIDLDQDGDLDLVYQSDRSAWSVHEYFLGQFTARRNIGSNGPTGFGDADGDGLEDVAYWYSSEVRFLKNLGALAFSTSTLVDSRSQVQALAMVDASGDQLADIVVSTGAHLWVYPSQGDGSFSSPTASIVGGVSQFGALFATDANSDGREDLFVWDSTLMTYTGSVTGFGAPRVQQGVGADVVDFDGDGVLDLFVAVPRLAWAKGMPDGSWEDYTTITEDRPRVTVHGDLDGDGDQDVLDYEGLSASDRSLFWFENLGSGTFASGVLLHEGCIGAITTGDFDGDLDHDIVYFASCTAELHFVESLGGGSFAAPISIPLSATYVNTVTSLDIDGDGVDDLVVFDGDKSTWQVFDELDGFSTPVTLAVSPRLPMVDDVTGDGIPDLVYVEAQTYEIYLAPASSPGVFTSPTLVVNDYDRLTGVTLGDMDFDGDAELVYMTEEDVDGFRSLKRALADQGTLQAASTLARLPEGAAIGSLHLADVAEDGDIDVLMFTGIGTILIENMSGLTDSDGDGAFSDVDCDDTDPTRFPTAHEICDGVDNDCNGVLGPDEEDLDGDGEATCEGDCDDTNSSVNSGSGATEVPYNGVDDDCDPSTPDDDLDNDGYDLVDDCDDTNPAVNPGATEVLYNGIDDDCDAATLDGDADGDGYDGTVDCDDDDPDVNPGMSEQPYNGLDDDCDPSTADDDLDGDGYNEDQDCDDTDSTISPAATEVPYDGVDNDCDPSTPDDDLDGDGWGIEYDCDDTNPDVNPAAFEIQANGVDDDCDWTTPDQEGDQDNDGYDAGIDCDDTDASVNPGATETPYNGVDDDCDSTTPDDDLDGDGYPQATDCDDDNAAVNPGVTELQDNGIDDDCDPSTPDSSTAIDADSDGWYDTDDCDDNNSAVNPGATEIPGNGIDDDCDPSTPDGTDADSDGWDATLDCDDSDASVNPGVAEIPYNGVDDDCDSTTPDDDLDGDGILLQADCDDTNAAVAPGADEICGNGVDEDCDTEVDEDCGTPTTSDDGGCGCETGTGGGWSWALLPALALLRRRHEAGSPQ